MNFSEEEREELEAQYQDVDQKLIMIQILMELSAIRRALTEPREEPETDTHVCSACGETVPKAKRQSHAVNQHNAPEGIPPDELPMF